MTTKTMISARQLQTDKSGVLQHPFWIPACAGMTTEVEMSKTNVLKGIF